MSTLKTTPEDQFESMLIQLKAPYVKQHRPIKGRRYAFDFAIVNKKLAFEIEGGIFRKHVYNHRRTGDTLIHAGGRHLDSLGFMNDCKKYLLSQLSGWKVIRIPSPWLTHYTRHKPKEYMIPYEELKDMIATLLEIESD